MKDYYSLLGIERKATEN